MIITIQDEFTNKTITIKNALKAIQEDNCVKIWTSANGNNDFTTFKFYFIVGVISGSGGAAT